MGRLTDSLRAALHSSGAEKQAGQMDALDQAGATAAAEQAIAQVVADATIDPTDPDFAPVEGVGLDDYARICRALVDAGRGDEERSRAVVAAQGLDWPTWTRVSEGWNERIMRNQAVGLRYSTTFVDRG